jgi:UDP-glucose 4-epimerase
MTSRTGPPASLVTGGAGFLGSHVAEAILDDPGRRDEQLILLDDLSGGFRENVPESSRVQFVEGCITDRALVDDLFRRYQFKYVYHLAAYAAEGLSHFIRRFNYANNVVGSATLISAAIENHCECFVFTSSIAVYGSGQNPLHERDAPVPEDPYGVAKYTVEMDLEAARRLFGLNYVVFRPHNVYGERQNVADRYRNVVGIFMNQLMQGLPMSIFGDGSQRRAFSYVRDSAPLMAAAPQIDGALNETFNVGADQPWSVLDLAGEVARAMGVDATIQHLPGRHEVQHAWCDHEKARAVFPQWRETPLAQGLQVMAEWVRQQTPRPPSPPADLEVTRELPEVWKKAKD